MSHTQASVRAASLAVSGAFLAAAALVALTTSFTLQQIDFAIPEPAIVRMERPPVTPPTTDPTPNVRRQTDDVIVFDDAALTQRTPLEVPEIGYLGPIAAAGPALVSEPHWTRRPEDLSRYYPPRALRRGMEGAVTLDCIVTVTGALECQPISESPQGWGFGEAAVRIAREHRMVPATREGVAVEGRYRMRVPFNLD